MRVLTIGGTGTISTGITRMLVERGDDVTVYNRGKRDADIPDVARMVGDRTHYAAFEAQMADAGSWDAVVDMVAYVPADVESAIRAFRGRTAQYVFCSTVDVYTKPAARYPILPDAERQPSPSFPYALNKAKCEAILEEAHAQGELVSTLIRPAWTYVEGGSVLHPFGWSSYYLDRLRRGRPVVVPGDGTSFWVACHRDDVARAFVHALGNEITFGRGYHVTGEEWLTWNAHTRIMAEAVGGPDPEIVPIPTGVLGRLLPKRAEWCVENFHFNNIFDNREAREDLGFRYTLPYAEGARRMVAWFDDHGEIEDSDAHPFYDRLIAAWREAGDAMAAALSDLD
jgi:nucleoside-diphosphate-sugar epimerase